MEVTSSPITSDIGAYPEIYHLNPKNYIPRPFDSTPLELVTEIITLVCGIYFDDRRAFVKSRSVIISVCRAWRDLVIGCGAFWSSYVLAPNNHYKDAVTCLERGSTFGLKLQVFVTHVSTWPAPNSDQLSVGELIILFKKYAPACKQLKITSYDTPTLTALTSAIDGVDLPRLDVLILNGEGIEFGAPSYLPSPDSFVFTTHGPSTLKLTGLSLNWNVPTFFTNITTLILDHIWPWVTARKLHHILLSSTRLTRLSFNRMRIVAKPTNGDENLEYLHLTAIPMAYLEELHLGYSRDVTPIASLIRAPKLHSFQVAFTYSSDLQDLQSCAELLAPVTSLIMEGFDSEHWVPPIHAVMPNLTSINLTWASSHLFRTMGKDASNLWPKLKALSASDIHYKDVKDFLDARSPICTNLDELSIIYSSDYNDDMDDDSIQIVQQRVTKVTLNSALEYPWFFGIQ